MTPGRLTRRGAAVGGALLAFALGLSRARADEPAGPTTSTSAVSVEVLELARNLDVLEDLDLLAQWELFELMPLLEDNDEQ